MQHRAQKNSKLPEPYLPRPLPLSLWERGAYRSSPSLTGRAERDANLSLPSPGGRGGRVEGLSSSPLGENATGESALHPPLVSQKPEEDGRGLLLPSPNGRGDRGEGAFSPSLPVLAQRFAPISLQQMDAVALLNRTDTKFILTNAQLLQALSAVQQDYWMLSIRGQRLNHYRTLYFDLPDFELYNLHVNGRADRYKVRSREYTDSGLSFLEVKHKTPKGRTIKARINTPQPVTRIGYMSEDWLHGVFPYDTEGLEPKIWNTFTRLTLVSKQLNERVTLDVDLRFYTPIQVAYLDELAIAEVKMDASYEASPFLAQMRTQKIRARGFSKYIIGVSILYAEVKKNALKPKLLWLNRLNRGA